MQGLRVLRATIDLGHVGDLASPGPAPGAALEDAMAGVRALAR